VVYLQPADKWNGPVRRKHSPETLDNWAFRGSMLHAFARAISVCPQAGKRAHPGSARPVGETRIIFCSRRVRTSDRSSSIIRTLRVHGHLLCARSFAGKRGRVSDAHGPASPSGPLSLPSGERENLLSHL